MCETVACQDSLSNIRSLPLIIGSSADTSKATTASLRSEDFKVTGMQPDDGGEGESVTRGIPGCVEEGEKPNIAGEGTTWTVV